MADNNVSIPLLRKCVEWAEAEAAKPNPTDRQWFQGAWIKSGTGLAMELAEDRVSVNPALDFHTELEQLEPHCGTAYCIAGFIGQELDANYATTDCVDGVHVSVFAARALGLNSAHHPLFSADNTIEDVRRIAEDLAGERL